MKPVIIDTSVTLAWLLWDEPWHAQAVAFREEIISGELKPLVAHHHPLEIRHALVRAAHRNRCAWAAMTSCATCWWR